MLRFLLSLILLLAHGYIYPQPYRVKKISAEAIGIKQGLSQGMINCIWQDHFGFMWFGTMDGLNRYDGYNFQVFRNNAYDSTSISGNFITTIFEDSKGRLWIGTALNGLNLFIPEKEQFVHFTTNTQPAVSNNMILSIQEDMYGYIWIATQHGLNKLTVHDTIAVRKGHADPAISIPGKNLSVSIRHIHLADASGKELFTVNPYEPVFLITKTGSIWVSASNSLFKMMPSKTGEEKFVQEKIILLYSQFDDDNRYIYKIIEDTVKDIICFKGNHFLLTLNEKSGKTDLWNCAPLNLTMGRNQVVFDNGILWERTPDGLMCFDVLKKTLQHVQPYNTEHEKTLKIPFSFFRDRAGIIWIGSGGYGLLKYNPATEGFHKIITSSITWMSATHSGDVLLMTPETQYLKKSGSTQQSEYSFDTFFKSKLLAITKEFPDVPLQDKEGTYWFYMNGIAKYNPGKKIFVILKKLGGTIFPSYLDSRDRLWYATSHSFCLFNKTDYTVTSYPFPGTPAISSPYKFCQVIYQDARDIFWLGTTAGLYCFNEKTQQWRQYKNQPGDSASLSNNIVFTICDDPQKPGEYIWVGTNGGGLNRLCTSTGKFEHIGIQEGLPNMVVYGILADNEKQLWMSTNNGIACMMPQYANNKNGKTGNILQNKFRYFYEENGLQSNEFNRNAYCKTKDGILFFGGVNGFNYFNPAEVAGNTSTPNIVITNFKINNKPVSFRPSAVPGNTEAKSALSKPVFLTDTIELEFAQNMIAFEFASLDYTASEKNLYQYKLDGFDEYWLQAGSNHSATYTNLDPGTYTFTVKGSNSDGVWNEQGTSIYLIVHAPWYMTWWFRALVIIVSAAILYFSFRYRLQQKIKLSNIRNNIASDLHDEIGSTLSSVYIYSEVAQQSPEPVSPQTKTYLKQISSDTGNMIGALSDIVWTVNAKNDRFENIINRMRAAAVELFEAKGYQLHLQFTDVLNASKLGMTHRKNFYLFYKEAINNAAKYACGKNVWITLTYKKPFISLSVKDDGKGFDVTGKLAGNGLTNLQKRADELKGTCKIISSPGAGTEVYLVFPA